MLHLRRKTLGCLEGKGELDAVTNLALELTTSIIKCRFSILFTLFAARWRTSEGPRSSSFAGIHHDVD